MSRMKNRLILVWLLSIIASVRGNDYMNYYGVILAGGVGERLWPLSRRNNPKQFLSVDSQKTLLEQSIDRLSLAIKPENVWLTISAQHNNLKSDAIGRVLVEPISRNTGPAVLYTCLELYKKNPNAIVVFVPADSYIPINDYALFSEYIKQALAFVSQNNVIGLFGVTPTYPATGYGYIEYDDVQRKTNAYKVRRFHEKPSQTLASTYAKMPNMLWNVGIFAGKVSVFIDEFQRIAPELYEEINAWKKNKKEYSSISNISIDYAIMERSNHLWVLPVDFAWGDVGNIEVFLSLKQKLHNSATKIISIDASNNLIDVSKKMVALIGVDNLCIVETPDTLLITKKNEAEKVRKVVAHLKETNQENYL